MLIEYKLFCLLQLTRPEEWITSLQNEIWEILVLRTNPIFFFCFLTGTCISNRNSYQLTWMHQCRLFHRIRSPLLAFMNFPLAQHCHTLVLDLSHGVTPYQALIVLSHSQTLWKYFQYLPSLEWRASSYSFWISCIKVNQSHVGRSRDYGNWCHTQVVCQGYSRSPVTSQQVMWHFSSGLLYETHTHHFTQHSPHLIVNVFTHINSYITVTWPEVHKFCILPISCSKMCHMLSQWMKKHCLIPLIYDIL